MNDAHKQKWQAVLPFFSSELFQEVQQKPVFEDSKTFADACVTSDWQSVLTQYETDHKSPDFNLIEFVNTHFVLPEATPDSASVTSVSALDYVHKMWDVLTRQPDTRDNSSLIGLSRPYIVPGGRFREIYYWDSYFTALGLIDSKRHDMVINMLENFLDILNEVGCVPNGNRAYYHTRSQPPILALMFELVEEHLSVAQKKRVVTGLLKEHAFWMQGEKDLSLQPLSATCRVVRMPDASVLNRYYDNADTPRPESWREDIETAKQAGAKSDEFYRNIRAACESGWDFSSRWLAEPDSLASIRTTEIVPVDLNSLLYRLEKTLARIAPTALQQQHFDQRATARKQALQTFLWSHDYYYDFVLSEGKCSPVVSAAGAVPLFAQIATTSQAKAVQQKLEQCLLKAGGIVTTSLETGQQWDTPNGWAPLQYFCVQGLINYGHQGLADTIMQRFISTVEHHYEHNGVMLEKYNVCTPHLRAGGGEYDIQLGFGWTNGVYKRFKTWL